MSYLDDQINSECEGCSLLDPTYYPVCHLFAINGISKDCPCRTCIVKATCSRICLERETYYRACEVKYKMEDIFIARDRYLDTITRKGT